MTLVTQVVDGSDGCCNSGVNGGSWIPDGGDRLDVCVGTSGDEGRERCSSGDGNWMDGGVRTADAGGQVTEAAVNK